MIPGFFFVVGKRDETVTWIERGVEYAAYCELVSLFFAAYDALAAVEYEMGCLETESVSEGEVPVDFFLAVVNGVT